MRGGPHPDQQGGSGQPPQPGSRPSWLPSSVSQASWDGMDPKRRAIATMMSPFFMMMQHAQQRREGGDQASQLPASGQNLPPAPQSQQVDRREALVRALSGRRHTWG